MHNTAKFLSIILITYFGVCLYVLWFYGVGVIIPILVGMTFVRLSEDASERRKTKEYFKGEPNAE